MEEKVANEGGDGLIVAVGLTGGRKSKYILRWAMDKFLPESNGNVTFKLLHVYPKITAVPTPSQYIRSNSICKNSDALFFCCLCVFQFWGLLGGFVGFHH